MELWEKTISQKDIYCGRVVHLHVDEVALPSGHKSTREIVNHPGGVGILAIDDDNNVLLVEQYRYAYGKVLTEIPAGKLERGEDPYLAAMRELREETGASVEKLTPLGELYPTPGYCDEIIRLYLAKDLTFSHQDLDDDEFLNVKRVPFEEFFEAALSGKLKDAKTVLAALKAKYLLNL